MAIKRKSPRGIREDELVGRYEIMATSGKDFKCGAFCLEISTSYQLGKEMTLTPEIFDMIIHSKESIAWHTARNWLGPEYEANYTDEQLALVLYLFGLSRGINLHLGLIAEGQPSYVLSLPTLEETTAQESDDTAEPDERPVKTVWIYNDNAMFTLGRLFNHYSGVKLVTRRS
ncbi:unnamed protein product [Discula destructiva]